MLPSVVALTMLGVVSAQLQCSVNVTQGVPWQGDNTTYNWLNMKINPGGGFDASLPWQAQIETNGQVVDRLGFNGTGDVTDYWNPLVSGTTVNLSAVISSEDAPELLDFEIGGSPCQVGAAVTQQATGAIESGIQPVAVSGTTLTGVDGKPLTLKGLNWFGFETPGGSMVDGLWEGSSSITLDFPSIVSRFQLLGFNAVRLPFSFANLYGTTQPQSFTQSCSTDTQGTILKATTDPSAPPSTNTPPTLSEPGPLTQGVCSANLPSDSVLNRFLYVIRFFAQNDFYVLVDNHLNMDPTAIQDPTGWAQDWGKLATSIASDPDTAAYVMYDIMNEPDSQHLRWEASNGLPAAADLYLNAMDSISAANPSAVFFIEGLGQVGTSICWVSLDVSTCLVLSVSDLITLRHFCRATASSPTRPLSRAPVFPIPIHSSNVC